MFAAWMRIVAAVPGSVLWLLADNPWAADNLRQQATAQGIDPQRLVFSERASPADYLARYLVPDLFLDTFPFNAGTTANDALWMGLPVLTMSGRSFASRMAGALLTAAGLPELITTDLQAYEDQAVALAGDDSARQAMRDTLAQAKIDGALFDSLRFTRALEKQYTALLSNLQSLAPAPTAAAAPAPAATNADLEDIAATVAHAEACQAAADMQGAIRIYRQWLAHAQSPHCWMVRFNLGLLLEQTGDRLGARTALALALHERPDFKPAQIALQQIT